MKRIAQAPKPRMSPRAWCRRIELIPDEVVTELFDQAYSFLRDLAGMRIEVVAEGPEPPHEGWALLSKRAHPGPNWYV